jgi:transposase
MDDSVRDATTFTKNRDRLLNQQIARSFFRRVVERARGLMSNEHFTVDGTLIEARLIAARRGMPATPGGNTPGRASNRRSAG